MNQQNQTYNAYKEFLESPFQVLQESPRHQIVEMDDNISDGQVEINGQIISSNQSKSKPTNLQSNDHYQHSISNHHVTFSNLNPLSNRKLPYKDNKNIVYSQQSQNIDLRQNKLNQLSCYEQMGQESEVKVNNKQIERGINRRSLHGIDDKLKINANQSVNLFPKTRRRKLTSTQAETQISLNLNFKEQSMSKYRRILADLQLLKDQQKQPQSKDHHSLSTGKYILSDIHQKRQYYISRNNNRVNTLYRSLNKHSLYESPQKNQQRIIVFIKTYVYSHLQSVSIEISLLSDTLVINCKLIGKVNQTLKLVLDEQKAERLYKESFSDWDVLGKRISIQTTNYGMKYLKILSLSQLISNLKSQFNPNDDINQIQTSQRKLKLKKIKLKMKQQEFIKRNYFSFIQKNQSRLDHKSEAKISLNDGNLHNLDHVDKLNKIYLQAQNEKQKSNKRLIGNARKKLSRLTKHMDYLSPDVKDKVISIRQDYLKDLTQKDKDSKQKIQNEEFVKRIRRLFERLSKPKQTLKPIEKKNDITAPSKPQQPMMQKVQSRERKEGNTPRYRVNQSLLRRENSQNSQKLTKYHYFSSQLPSESKSNSKKQILNSTARKNSFRQFILKKEADKLQRSNSQIKKQTQNGNWMDENRVTRRRQRQQSIEEEERQMTQMQVSNRVQGSGMEEKNNQVEFGNEYGQMIGSEAGEVQMHQLVEEVCLSQDKVKQNQQSIECRIQSEEKNQQQNQSDFHNEIKDRNQCENEIQGKIQNESDGKSKFDNENEVKSESKSKDEERNENKYESQHKQKQQIEQKEISVYSNEQEAYFQSPRDGDIDSPDIPDEGQQQLGSDDKQNIRDVTMKSQDQREVNEQTIEHADSMQMNQVLVDQTLKEKQLQNQESNQLIMSIKIAENKIIPIEKQVQSAQDTVQNVENISDSKLTPEMIPQQDQRQSPQFNQILPQVQINTHQQADPNISSLIQLPKQLISKEHVPTLQLVQSRSLSHHHQPIINTSTQNQPLKQPQPLPECHNNTPSQQQKPNLKEKTQQDLQQKAYRQQSTKQQTEYDRTNTKQQSIGESKSKALLKQSNEQIFQKYEALEPHFNLNAKFIIIEHSQISSYLQNIYQSLLSLEVQMLPYTLQQLQRVIRTNLSLNKTIDFFNCNSLGWFEKQKRKYLLIGSLECVHLIASKYGAIQIQTFRIFKKESLEQRKYMMKYIKDFEKFGFLYQKKMRTEGLYEIKGIIKVPKQIVSKDFEFPQKSLKFTSIVSIDTPLAQPRDNSLEIEKKHNNIFWHLLGDCLITELTSRDLGKYIDSCKTSSKDMEVFTECLQKQSSSGTVSPYIFREDQDTFSLEICFDLPYLQIGKQTFLSLRAHQYNFGKNHEKFYLVSQNSQNKMDDNQISSKLLIFEAQKSIIKQNYLEAYLMKKINEINNSKPQKNVRLFVPSFNIKSNLRMTEDDDFKKSFIHRSNIVCELLPSSISVSDSLPTENRKIIELKEQKGQKGFVFCVCSCVGDKVEQVMAGSWIGHKDQTTYDQFS